MDKVLQRSLSRKEMLQQRKYVLHTHPLMRGMMMHGIKFLSENFRLDNGSFIPGIRNSLIGQKN
jgi:hypothetical protein